MGQVHFHLLPKHDAQAAYVALMRVHGRRLAAVPGTGLPGDTWGKAAMHALTSEGGFTLHDHVGDAPTSGYMVSTNKDAERTIPLDQLRPEHIEQFRQEHADDLADPNSYLGGWVHEGNAYLDVSRHENDLDKATDLAHQHNQLGIYDIGAGKTIMTPAQEAQQAAASLHLLPDDDNLLAVNILRMAGGLDPIEADDEGNVIAKAAQLRLL